MCNCIMISFSFPLPCWDPDLLHYYTTPATSLLHLAEEFILYWTHPDLQSVSGARRNVARLNAALVYVVAWPWLDTKCQSKSFDQFTTSVGLGRENITKGSWAKIRTWRSLTSHHHGQNRSDLKRSVQFTANQIRVG